MSHALVFVTIGVRRRTGGLGNPFVETFRFVRVSAMFELKQRRGQLTFEITFVLYRCTYLYTRAMYGSSLPLTLKSMRPCSSPSGDVEM